MFYSVSGRAFFTAMYSIILHCVVPPQAEERGGGGWSGARDYYGRKKAYLPNVNQLEQII